MESMARDSIIIESGIIMEHGTDSSKQVPYKIVFLNPDDLDQILELQDFIVANLNDWDLFRFDDYDYWRNHFTIEDSVMGVRVENRLIAYHVFSVPTHKSENLGHAIGLSPDNLSKVAHLETVGVHPAFKSNHLQIKMLEHTLKVLIQKNYPHICATVSPRNHRSLETLFGFGFMIKGFASMYQGRLRAIVYKNLEATHCPQCADPIEVHADDIEKQEQLHLMGYAGFQMKQLEDGVGFVYGK